MTPSVVYNIAIIYISSFEIELLLYQISGALSDYVDKRLSVTLRDLGLLTKRASASPLFIFPIIRATHKNGGVHNPKIGEPFDKEVGVNNSPVGVER